MLLVVAGYLGITAKENREIRETEIAILSFGAYLNWEVSKRYRIPRNCSVNHARYKNRLCLIKCTLEEAGR